jgi:hypothetical protein
MLWSLFINFLGHNTIFRESFDDPNHPTAWKGCVVLAEDHTFHLLDLALIPGQGM